MPQIQIAEKLLPILTTPKRLKIAVGGRGGSKSIAFADCFIKFCEDGDRLCCAREYQNLIDESVHPLIKSRISELDSSCVASASNVVSPSGGEIFYRGLSRNPDGLKSMFGVKKIWVEEAQALSDQTLDLLAPTIREDDSEIWMSMNRGSSKDPISQRYLVPYEKELAKSGFYEDSDILIVEINWRDNPWFPSVLDQERRRDKKLLSRAKYDHIWEGHYSDTVEDAIIEPEWFDACVDAHVKLGFEPRGQEKVAYDPSDTGDDKAVAYSHGSVIMDVQSTSSGRIDTATDWATTYAIEKRVDAFIWDGDGIGMGLKRQVATAFEGKKTEVAVFQGSNGADCPDAIYEPLDGGVKNAKTNKETFANKRAQYYWQLRDRMFKTYLAITDGNYTNPDELISFSSKIEDLSTLRAELCRIPRKYVASGRIQLMSKPEMKKHDIESPNMADAVMMTALPVAVRKKKPERNYPRLSIA